MKLKNEKFEEYRAIVAEIRKGDMIPDRYAYCILDLLDILKANELVELNFNYRDNLEAIEKNK